MAKPNITKEDVAKWDTYVGKKLEPAVEAIYKHATDFSSRSRTWYWTSIERKKLASLWCRWLALSLLVIGTAMQVLSAIPGDVDARLAIAQISVAVLALGALLHFADRVLGFSNGWLRYITTVTAMEALARKFDLDWAGYVIKRPARTLEEADVEKLFEICVSFENELLKQQNDETEKWVADYNAGSALLGELIKSQRETSEKVRDAAQAAMTARDTVEEARKKAEQPGVIQLKFTYKTGRRTLIIAVDKGPAAPFEGSAWASNPLTPGMHVVKITDQGASGDTVLALTVPPNDKVERDVEIA